MGAGGGGAQQLHAKTAQCSEKQQSPCQGGGGFKFEKKMLEKQEENGHRFPCILYVFHSPPNQPTYFISKRCLKMLTNGRQTDARVIGILLAHLRAFGGGGLWVQHRFGSSFFYKKMFENVDERTTDGWTDGRQSHWYTNNSPRNLQLKS